MKFLTYNCVDPPTLPLLNHSLFYSLIPLLLLSCCDLFFSFFFIADFNPLLLIFKFQIISWIFKVYALNLKLKFLSNFHFTCKTTFQTEVCVATVSEMRLNAICPGSFASVAQQLVIMHTQGAPSTQLLELVFCRNKTTNKI